MIFGSMFGWIHAGYSILFQFISTKTIDSFYHRYERVTLQITTKKSKEIVEAYIQYYRHGISCVEAIGGYSKQPMNLLHTVVSSYEVQDIIDLMKDVDPDLIVNVIKTENYISKIEKIFLLLLIISLLSFYCFLKDYSLYYKE